MSPEEIQRQLQQAFERFTAGETKAAEQDVRAVLKVTPNDVNAINLLAGVLRAKGDKLGALAAFERAIVQAPNLAPLLTNRANLLLELGRAEEAVTAFDAALALRPGHPDALVNRGQSLAALARHDDALRDFEDAHKAGAGSARLHQLWALSLAALERPGEALSHLDAALAFDPYDADAWDNRGALLHDLDRLEEALASNDRALALKPDHRQAWSNRALTLFALKRIADARIAFDRALALSPGDALLGYELGVSALAMHDLPGGWSGFEQRWAAGVIRSPQRDKGQRFWRGESLDGALRIWPEQGIGDEILFARLALIARERRAPVILECEPRLVPLFARSFPSLHVRPAYGPRASAPASAGVVDEAEGVEITAQIASGSLGAVLDVGLADLRGGSRYLVADAPKRDALRARYETLARGRRIIGIAWSSNAPKLGAAKSAPLMDWGALLRRDGLFVNLQYGDVADEIADARSLFGCEIIEDTEVNQLTDLDAFAAQVAAMDQIVSVSNTTVHFAGALGVWCSVLVAPARGRLWYWGLEGLDTPWYESLRLVRRELSQSREEQVAKAAALLSQT